MMSMRGDGKPVSFIEDCAVPLAHLADYVDRLTEIFHRHGTRGTWYAHASVGTLHVRPILDMRRDGAAEDARDRRRGGGDRPRIQGCVLRRAWRRARAQRMGGVAVRTAADARVRGDQGPLRSRGSDESRARSSAHREWTMRRCFAFRRRTGPFRSIPALDWSAWNVQNDPLTGRTVRSGQRPAIPRGASARRSRCATTTAIAASSTRARCARAIASRATRCI